MLTAGTVAVLLGCATAVAVAGDGLTLHAEAGLGGAGRPGRWTPVRIAVVNSGRDFSGEIVVEWGDARLHRAFEAAAPSRTTVELFIRTQDVRGSMAVSLVSNGDAVASVDVPILMVPEDEPWIVCVEGAARKLSDAACTTMIVPEALPQSMRGYDGADEVRLQADADSRLAPEQRAALRRWRAYHVLEAQDLLPQAPRALWTASPETGTQWSTGLACVIALSSLLAAAWVWLRARGSALRSYATLAGAAVVGVMAGVMAGRGGPGSAVVVRHATTVQQVADGAVVSMRGTIEYPAYDDYAIHLRPADGALTLRSPNRSEQWLDGTGAPLRRGTFGRGNREEVELEAVSDFAPFGLLVTGDTVRVSNVSDAPLTDCRFPEGFSHADAGTLPPGGSTEARSFAANGAQFFSCTMTDSPLLFSDARYPVRLVGFAVVAIRLPSHARAGDPQ